MGSDASTASIGGRITTQRRSVAGTSGAGPFLWRPAQILAVTKEKNRVRFPSLVLTLLLLSAALVLPASSADAQSLTTVYQVRIYLEGASSPVTTYDIPAQDVRCGQPKVAAGATVYNPTVIRWDDELNPTGHDCTWTDTGTGPLFALPVSVTNVYRARLVATDPIGSSPESAPSNPFSRRGLPAAPTGLRIGAGQ